jgi:hypothetical protein
MEFLCRKALSLPAQRAIAMPTVSRRLKPAYLANWAREEDKFSQRPAGGDSDRWPDWPETPLDDAETRAFAERNSLPSVLGDIVRLLVAVALLVAAIGIGFAIWHLR